MNWKPRAAATLLAALTAIAACAPAPTTTGAGGRRTPRAAATETPGDPGASPTPYVVATPTPAPGAATPTPGPLAASPTPGVPAAITLQGLVRAPASLLANNGAGLIGNHAAGYRVGYRAGYGLRQVTLAQVAVAGITVGLFDALGAAVVGADGRPMTAVTDATGRYAFAAPLPAQNLVVRATSPGSDGELSRLVVKGVAAADVDLASSVVARYVLDRYVAGQPDPKATLERLPADAEAETVRLAAAAGAPGSLAPGALVAEGTRLRGADGAFDGQMETVRRLLIAAGVSELGAGLPADQVYMRRLFASDVAPDGTLWTWADDDKVLWRVGPDGKLAAMAGNGERPTGPKLDRAGADARHVALDYLWTLHLDAQGRPMVHENDHGVWRLEPDGKLTVLHTPAAITAAFGSPAGPTRGGFVRPDGTLLGLDDGALWALAPGGTRQKLADAPGVRARDDLTELPGNAGWLAHDSGQLVWLRADQAPETVFADGDPRVKGSQWLDYNEPTLDARGNFYYVATADGKLHRRRPDGTDAAIADRSALTLGLAWAREASNGQTYVADCFMGDNLGATIVRRLGGTGAPGIVAGVDGLPKGFTADGRVPLLYPGGLDVAPDGTLFLADAGALTRIGPDGVPTRLAAQGTAGGGGVGALTFTGVRRLADGTVAARAFNTQWEVIVTEKGGWAPIIKRPKSVANPWNIVVHAWDVAPDGTAVASDLGYAGGTGTRVAQVFRARPGEAATVLVPASAGFADIAKLAFGADGKLWMRAYKDGDAKPGRYTIADDGTVTPAPEGSRVPEAQDKLGRAYEGDASTNTLGDFGDRKLWRQEADGSWKAVAGAGTGLLAGDTLDDSIGWVEDLRFDAAGNLYVRDVLRRQVRRIPPDQLK